MIVITACAIACGLMGIATNAASRNWRATVWAAAFTGAEITILLGKLAAQ